LCQPARFLHLRYRQLVFLYLRGKAPNLRGPWETHFEGGPLSQRAFICGLSGPNLSPAEAAFLAAARPAGLILFARNVEDPDQVRRLIAAARTAAGEKVLVLVDQEGGRVQRLCAPHWRRYPAARAFGGLRRTSSERAKEAARLCARAMACDLHALGFNATCAPVLDVPVAGADNIIGDRAYGEDAAAVIELGGAAAEGLLAGGILPVMKHIPGHGRAMADSHLALPVVDTPAGELERSDFAPFRALKFLPVAMTAHVVFTAIDASAPVTVSPKAVQEVIRGFIGFEGLLMSDDLSMQALSGPVDGRVAASLAAGCDLALHCNGNMEEMAAVAAAAPVLDGKALVRFERALAALREPEPFAATEAEEARAEALAVPG
jgi:beta-N-acetylhexosaminidase